MRTLSEICRTIRSNKALSKILPDRLFRSIPVPTVTPNGIGIGFYYYLAGGKPGESKTLFPPIIRIILDRKTEEPVVLEKAPSVWMLGHQATTQLGTYPSQTMKGLDRTEIDALYEEYFAATDRLMQTATNETELTASPEFPTWKLLYEKVHEEGFDQYFATFFPALARCSTTPTMESVTLPSETVTMPLSSVVEQLKRETKQLMDVLEQSRQHIQRLDESGLKREWTRIHHITDTPSFSVVVVGEFNRGKTTLINKLLGTRLPEGDLPTTALMTQIVYGEKNRLTFIERSGEKRFMEPTDANFDALQADNDGNDPKGVLVLEIPNSWLGDRRLSVIDTPGAGDLTEHRAELAAEAVMGADAALVTVSATMPLSIGERVYIEEHIFVKKVPKVAVVITKLDLIPKNERQAVVDNITHRVKSWQPLAEIWLANDEPVVTDAINTPVKGIAGIKKAIEHWRLDPYHLLSRQQQIQTQLRQLLELVTVSLVTRIELARADQDEINAENDRLRQNVERDSLDWGDLEIEMNRRAFRSGEILSNQMFEFENTVCEKLHYQLSRTSNPREWWEKDLPFCFSAELKVIHRQISGMLQERLLTDIKWLGDQAEKRFATQWRPPASVGTIISKPDDTENTQSEATSICDLNQIRRYTRVGIAVATFGIMASTGGTFGVALLVPAFAALIMEKGHQNLQTEQVTMLSKRIPDVVHETLDKIVQEGKDNIKKYYGRAVAEIRTQKKLWIDTKLEAIRISLQAKSDEATTVIWNQQLKEVSELLDHLPK